MDAKYNRFIDSVEWRLVVNVAVFALWLAASVGLLAAAGA
jgi:hypothetical protein